MKPFLLTDYLDHSILISPDRVAIEDRNGSITYRQLWERSRNLARFLSSQETVTHQPIALYFPKGIPCVIAMMGVLYHGGIYAPLDVRAPFSYVEKILHILDCEWILTDESGYQRLQSLGVTQKIINIDKIGEQTSSLPVFVRKALDCDPAFLLFTSGSTGIPKGVAISHRRVMDYIEWAKDYFSVSDQTVIGNQAPFLFTVSVMDVYLCLSAGAHLCLIPEHTLASPKLLLSYLREKRVTFIFWVPSVYANVWQSGELQKTNLSELKQCLFVGEPMHPNILNGWISCLPQARFYNLYGSTETDMTLCYPISGKQSEDQGIPLGKPRQNIDVFLLHKGKIVTDHEQIGEICIRGTTLANGYWNDSEKTSKVFIQNPFQDACPETIYTTGDLGSWDVQGNIVFHGRKDHQFKHLGYRMEANGIEEIALGSGMLAAACVQYDEYKKQIVLFYVSGTKWEPHVFRKFLIDSMPSYMLPTRFIELKEMRRTTSGKIDRVFLKQNYLHEEGLN